MKNGLKFAQEIRDTLDNDQEYYVVGDYFGGSPECSCNAHYIAFVVEATWPEHSFDGWEVTSTNITAVDGQSQLELIED